MNSTVCTDLLPWAFQSFIYLPDASSHQVGSDSEYMAPPNSIIWDYKVRRWFIDPPEQDWSQPKTQIPLYMVLNAYDYSLSPKYGEGATINNQWGWGVSVGFTVMLFISCGMR